VLEGTPLPPAALRSTAVLPKAVARLQQDGRHPQVAAAARLLAERWQAAAGPAAGAPAAAGGAAATAGPAGVPPAGGAAAEPPQAGAAAGQPEAALRKPSAVEMPHLMALGRKSLFGKSSTAPMPAQLGRSASGEGEAGTPRLLGAPVALRRVLSSEGEAAAAASPRAGAGALARSAPSVGPARTARPMSVDDIRKQKERQRASAALQSLGAAGGSGSSVAAGAGAGVPPAKRLRPEGEPVLRGPSQPPSRLAERPRQQAQQAQQQAPSRPAMPAPAVGSMPSGGAAAASKGPPPAGNAAPPPGFAPSGPPGFGGGWGPGPGPSGPAGAGVAAGGGLAAEAAMAVQHFEQDRQKRAAARRVQLVQEYVGGRGGAPGNYLLDV
jgi:hypothetical protein